MKVKVIPVLEDNYMYLIIEEHTREAVAVDVAVPKRHLNLVRQYGVGGPPGRHFILTSCWRLLAARECL